ncbi:hypothetical protein TNCV_4699731 [Trichonephila clavipes]|nr:hypothetical protein TNCV_4699731 [Trichonephila clavipes]
MKKISFRKGREKNSGEEEGLIPVLRLIKISSISPCAPITPKLCQSASDGSVSHRCSGQGETWRRKAGRARFEPKNRCDLCVSDGENDTGKQ